MKITTTVNGAERTADLDGHESAVDVIRDRFGLTGTKLVCGGGVCGACTALVDGTPVATCLLPSSTLRDRDVTTIEGVAAADGSLHPVQRAFLAHDALQCGYCTPGFIVDAIAFYDRWRANGDDGEPDRETIADALAGHLCRCGTYEGIYRAVVAACRGDHDDGTEEHTRVDAPQKVTGRALYTADVRLPGMLHGVIRRSEIASATVGPVEASADPVIVDLLGDDRTVRWAGQPIAAVAAETADEARRLAASLEIDMTPRPFVIDPDEAGADGAPNVYTDRAARKAAPNAAETPPLPAPWKGNRRGPNRMPLRGTVAKSRIRRARRSGDRGLVELEFRTTEQVHTAFEPHSCVADWSDPQRLRLWVSTQAVHHVAEQVAKRYGLHSDQVEVIADYVGGGFGAKLELTDDVAAAVELSRAARRPVRVVLDRHEELTATSNRPGMKAHVSMLADTETAELRAMVVDSDNHPGVAINNTVAGLAMLVYGRSPRLARDTDVVTNTPPGGPFRGPGGPNYAWALEQAVDEIGHRLGRDPIELRQQWDGNNKRQALYEWARGLPVWKDRPVTGSQHGRFRRGVGVAAANWLYIVDPDSEVTVEVEDGHLVAGTASQDMGTGSRTVVARAVAEVFGIAPGDVDVRLGRSDGSTPHGPTSGGSRTTVSLWPAAREAAVKLREKIGGDVSSAANGTRASATRGGDQRMRVVPVTINNFQLGRGLSGAVHVSEVEVDMRTGKTRVLTVHGGIAVGRIHAPDQARSQCEGSIIQGIGLALYEGRILDPHTGLTLTANLEDYRIPQLGDTPRIDIHFHEQGWEHVPGGGIGLGEVSTISPAASIGNAIFNATGWRPTTLPVRPDRVLEATA